MKMDNQKSVKLVRSLSHSTTTKSNHKCIALVKVRCKLSIKPDWQIHAMVFRFVVSDT